MDPLDLLIYDWTIAEVDYMTSGGIPVHREVIYAWCLDQQSRKVTVRVEGMKMELAVRLKQYHAPQHTAEIYDMIKKKWSHPDWDDTTLLGEKNPKRVRRRPVYYYNEGEPYMLLRVPTSRIGREIANWLKSGEVILEGSSGRGVVFDVSGYDKDIIYQLCTIQDLNSQGWSVFSNLTRAVRRISRRDDVQEYNVFYTNVSHCPRMHIINPKIAAYDLEVNSGDGHSFPRAFLIEDYVGMASVVVWNYGQYEQTQKSYLIVRGKVDPIEGMELICVDSEEELISRFRDLIRDEDPAVLTHYNGDSFDTFYLDDRHELLEMEWTTMGCHKNIRTRCAALPPSMGGRFRRGRSPIIPGITNIDVMKHAIENDKLRSYSLNSVSMEKLKKKKVDIGDYTTIFKAFHDWDDRRDNSRLTEVSKYGMEDSRLTAQLHDKYLLFDNMIEMTQASEVTWQTYVTKGRMKRTEAMMYKMGYKVNPKVSLATRPKPNMTSKGGSVSVPVTGRTDYLVTLDFTSLYPSIMIAFYLCYTTLLPAATLTWDLAKLKSVYKNINSMDDVRVVRCVQDDGIHVYRFVKNNVCEALLPKIEEMLLARRRQAKRDMARAYESGDSAMGDLLNAKQIALKITCNSAYGYLDAPGDKSCTEVAQCVTALGRLLKEWVAEEIERVHRYKTKYGDTDSVMPHIHDATSYADAKAKATLIMNDLNEKLQYIDTDDNGRLYVPDRSLWPSLYKKPLKLELEKIARAILIAKKTYLMTYTNLKKPDCPFEREENGDMAIRASGVPSVKRDRALIHCDIYREIGRELMDMKGMVEVTNLIWELARQVVYDMSHSDVEESESGSRTAEGDELPITVPYSRFIHSGKVGKTYEDDSRAAMAHLYHRMAKQGTPLPLGVRFNYYITDRPGANDLASRVATETEVEDNRKTMVAWVTGQSTSEPTVTIRPDRMYCYEKRFAPTIDTLFRVCFQSEIGKLLSDQCEKRLDRALKATYLRRGSKLIEALSHDEDPAIALRCYADKETFRVFERFYRQCNRNAYLSLSPAADAFRYFKTRSGLMEEIRQFGGV